MRLEILDLESIPGLYYVHSEKKALISCAVRAQLICAFVFACAKSRFVHDAVHFRFLFFMQITLKIYNLFF